MKLVAGYSEVALHPEILQFLKDDISLNITPKELKF